MVYGLRKTQRPCGTLVGFQTLWTRGFAVRLCACAVCCCASVVRSRGCALCVLNVYADLRLYGWCVEVMERFGEYSSYYCNLPTGRNNDTTLLALLKLQRQNDSRDANVREQIILNLVERERERANLEARKASLYRVNSPVDFRVERAMTHDKRVCHAWVVWAHVYNCAHSRCQQRVFPLQYFTIL